MQPFAVENSPPITDIAVVFSGDSIPRGYEKVGRNTSTPSTAKIKDYLTD